MAPAPAEASAVTAVATVAARGSVTTAGTAPTSTAATEKRFRVTRVDERQADGGDGQH